MEKVEDFKPTIEVYEHDIYFWESEYISRLPDPAELSKPTGNTFTGLIKYINRNINFSRSILEDINILNDIWGIYTDLVYKYNQKPTIEEYALLIGVSRDTIYTWLNGEYRNSDICIKLGSSRSDTVKKWSEECKLGRYKGAQAGNVGCIFLCKAVDGMVETAPMQIVNPKQALTDENLPRLGQNTSTFGQIEQTNTDTER